MAFPGVNVPFTCLVGFFWPIFRVNRPVLQIFQLNKKQACSSMFLEFPLVNSQIPKNVFLDPLITLLSFIISWYVSEKKNSSAEYWKDPIVVNMQWCITKPSLHAMIWCCGHAYYLVVNAHAIISGFQLKQLLMLKFMQCHDQ